jgi:hypothetical protein
MADMPIEGTKVHHPRFAGGCTARVKWVNKATSRRAETVAVEIIPDVPRHDLHRHRVWSVPTWWDFVASAQLPATQPAREGSDHE